MLYLQGLSNLQVGNVANYLDPIVSDPNENEDIKFLAAWVTLSLATERAERVEIPVFFVIKKLDTVFSTFYRSTKSTGQFLNHATPAWNYVLPLSRSC